MTEIWKVIPSCPNYEASSLGNIRNKKTQHVTKQYISNHGYCLVCLSSNNKSMRKKVHRLVLEAFVGPPTAPFGLHNNGTRTDNRIENLRWGTGQENMDDAKKHGTTARGNNIKNAILTPEKVLKIRILSKQGYSAERISKVIDAAPNTIRSVVRGKTWSWVNEGESA